MAHVSKAPNDKGWYCRWSFIDPDNPTKRRFQKKHFRTKKEAEKYGRSIEDRTAEGRSVDHNAGKRSVEHWANDWHRHYARTVSPSTATKSRGLLDATVIPRLGHMPVRAIDAAVVSDWLDWIEKNRTGHGRGPVSPATVRHHLLVLRNVLQHAVTAQAVPFNAALSVKPPTNKTRNRAPRKYVFLNKDEVARLADQLPYPYDLLVEFLAHTGLRVGGVRRAEHR